MSGRRIIGNQIPTTLSQESLQLLSTLNIGFMMSYMDFRVFEVNETLLNMLGIKREDIVGHHISEFYDPDEFTGDRSDDTFEGADEPVDDVSGFK